MSSRKGEVSFAWPGVLGFVEAPGPAPLRAANDSEALRNAESARGAGIVGRAKGAEDGLLRGGERAHAAVRHFLAEEQRVEALELEEAGLGSEQIAGERHARP